MKRIETYLDFINEEFFKKIKSSKRKNKRVDDAVQNILKFLQDNEIYDWNDFEKMSSFDREIVNKLIDHTAKDMNDVKDIRFELKLELCDSFQLREYLKELESLEEYEECALVLKKINQKNK